MHISPARIKKIPVQVSQPTAIDSALHLARDTAPHLASLADLLIPRLPRMPAASPNIRAHTRVRYSDPTPLAVAIHQPWMALDSDLMRNVIAVDIDHGDGIERAADVARQYRLPRATVIADPWTGRSHAVWALASPVCTSDAGRQGPQILADLAARLLAAVMGGTTMPAHCLLKSPWGLGERLQGRLMHRGPVPALPVVWEAHQGGDTGLLWHTVPGDLRTVELREVVAALADDYGETVAAPNTKRAFRRRRGDPSSLGRNCCLFDLVRWWSYDGFETNAAVIQAEAERVNATFADPLPGAEITATARSIARFMNARYRPRLGAGSTRGRDQLVAAGLDADKRRAVAGHQTALMRAARTDAKISEGLCTLLANDQPLTKWTLAAAAGVSYDTADRRWSKPDSANAALSGNEGDTARLIPFITSSNPTLSDLAAAVHTERQTRTIVAQLAALAAAARQPGAVPLPLPEIPANLARLPTVRAAVRAAQAAQADATRRAADRAARAEATDRSEEMHRRVAQGREGWAWWRQHLADLDTKWDALELDASERERPYLRMRRDAVFGARWRQWQAARRAVLGREPPPRNRRCTVVDAQIYNETASNKLGIDRIPLAQGLTAGA
jgi:hypothetical protein